MRAKLLIPLILSLFLSGCVYLQKGRDSEEAVFQPQQVKIGDSVIDVELAVTAEERSKGLSGRAVLPASQGMLFVFADKRIPGFWMRGMFFSIDIIWIADNEIVGITAVVPLPTSTDLQIYYPPQPVNRVLEVTSGTSRTKGWQVGDKVEYQ